MANIKLHLIHLEEVSKKLLEEEQKQTKLLIVIGSLIVFNLVGLVILFRS